MGEVKRGQGAPAENNKARGAADGKRQDAPHMKSGPNSGAGMVVWQD